MPKYSLSPLGLYFASKEEEGIDKIGNYDRGKIISNDQLSIFSGSTTKFGHTFFKPQKSYDDDISTSEIIKYTQRQGYESMRLNYSDFAYLKKLGVYPNNRLIIARRFLSPVNDDLTVPSDVANSEISPMSTLISWVDDNKDFFKVTYGEEWDKVDEASFKRVLNDIGHDVMMGDNRGKNLGDAAAGAFNFVSFPGWTEGLQYAIFKSLGMTDLSPFEHPYGNPNLIRTAMRRSTLGKDQAGSGLKAKIEVEMEVEYEQKFINGVDPTSVYYDIIANALTFGTSESRFQFRGDSVGKFSRFLDNLGSGNPDRVNLALATFIKAIQSSIQKVGEQLVELLSRDKEKVATEKTENNNEQNTNDDKENEIDAKLTTVKEILQKISFNVISGLVGKYKVRIIGIVNALTGSPSTPWHVTVGNPKRPIFSSGDMVVTDVTITLGKLLAFNDLPSSIKINFTLSNARPLGAQEIYKKLNCGKERTYTRVRKPFIESEMWRSGEEKKNLEKRAEKEVAINNNVSLTNNISDVGNAARDYVYVDHPGITALVGPKGYKSIKENGGFTPVPSKNGFKIQTPNGEKLTDVQFYPNGRAAFLENGNVLTNGTFTTDKDGVTTIVFDNNYAKPIKISKNGSII